MINFFIFVVSSNNHESQGGLFDFNATLPLMALQFLLFTMILNTIFYKPVTEVLDSRDEYIRNSLTSASASLSKADQLTRQYEQQLAEARRDAKELIRSSQKTAQKNILNRIKQAQISAEHSVSEASQQLTRQKEKALKTLENQIETLSNQIKYKLLEDN